MKHLLITGLLLYNMMAFAQSVSFTVKGNITGWKEKETVALMYTVNNENISDTTIVIDGKFQFYGQLNETINAAVVLISRPAGGTRDHSKFYMDGGLVMLNGTDSLKYAKVIGSKVTAEHEILKNEIDPLMGKLVAIKIKALKTSKAEQQSLEFKAMEKEYKELIETIQDTRTAFIKKYPNSFVSLVTLEAVAGNPINYQKGSALLDILGPELKKLPLGLKMAKALSIAKNTSIGAVLPDFSSLDTMRQPLRLQDVVKKGKVTLIDFWASWCGPCRAENPNVVKAFKAFHDKGFNILSVSLDKTEAAWKKAIAADGMPWYHVSSLKFWNEPVVIQFGISGVPDSFLLDADGKVVARGLRGQALYAKIQELLN